MMTTSLQQHLSRNGADGCAFGTLKLNVISLQPPRRSSGETEVSTVMLGTPGMSKVVDEEECN